MWHREVQCEHHYSTSCPCPACHRFWERWLAWRRPWRRRRSALRTILSCFLLMRLSRRVRDLWAGDAAEQVAGAQAAAGAQARPRVRRRPRWARCRVVRARGAPPAGALRAVLLPPLLLLAALADLALLLPDSSISALRRLHGSRGALLIRWSHDGSSPLPHSTLIVEDAAPVFAVFHGRVLPMRERLRRRFEMSEIARGSASSHDGVALLRRSRARPRCPSRAAATFTKRRAARARARA